MVGGLRSYCLPIPQTERFLVSAEAALRRRNVPIGIAAAAVAVMVWFAMTGSATLCAEVKRLISESASEFDAIRGEPVDGSTEEWKTSFAIGGASSCSIFVDPERTGYSCSWEYEATSGDGPVAYRETVDQVRSCLGGSAVESEDTSVNHPDFWALTTFEISDGAVTVSQKNKNALRKVFVSIGVNGL